VRERKKTPPQPLHTNSLTEQDQQEDLQVQDLIRVYKPEVWDVMREDIRPRLRGENLKGKTGKK